MSLNLFHSLLHCNFRFSLLSAMDDIFFFSDEDSPANYNSAEPFSDSDSDSKYIILKERDIRRRIKEGIKGVSSVLSLSKSHTCLLLLHYNWNAFKAFDHWFADEDQVRQRTGLFENPILEFSDDGANHACGICFESSSSMKSAVCGHPYCRDCWKSYISAAISDGVRCLNLRCPEPSCSAAISRNFVAEFASVEEKRKYDQYLVMAYVDLNKKIKWCPAPSCDLAVNLSLGSSDFDVSCGCGHRFCWNCTEESHRPVDCDTVAKWRLKNSLESENVVYILCFTKPCPKCKRPIEKDGGCMHMICRDPCRHEFCWLCLGNWKDHCYAACNIYAQTADMPTEKRKLADQSIDRYTHYYERWVANLMSMRKAMEDLKVVEDQTERLSEMQKISKSQLKFLREAWKQIIECRRVLRWSYPYGYFLGEKSKVKRRFFVYLQGEAELGLERLHDCAENESRPFWEADGPSEEFRGFRNKLVGFTRATGTYFNNLVTALENGLSDVKSKQPDSAAAGGRPCL